MILLPPRYVTAFFEKSSTDEPSPQVPSKVQYNTVSNSSMSLAFETGVCSEVMQSRDSLRTISVCFSCFLLALSPHHQDLDDMAHLTLPLCPSSDLRLDFSRVSGSRPKRLTWSFPEGATLECSVGAKMSSAQSFICTWDEGVPV